MAIFLLLVAIRICLPYIGFRLINYALEEKLENYKGSITDFDLALYKGSYRIEDLVLKKKTLREPFVEVKEIELSLSWSALLRKEITADIFIDSFHLSLVESKIESEKQTGEEEGNWQDVFDVIIPINIESLFLKNSSVKFTNKSLKEPIPIILDQISLEAFDLRTSRKDKADSKIKLKARLQEHAFVNVKGKINILSAPFLADLDVSLEKFNIKTINDNLRYYIPLDITNGELCLYGEIALDSNKIKGYSKIFLNDADIIASDQSYVSFKHFFYEIIAGMANWFLKNAETKNVATFIPFEGRRDGLEIDTSKLVNTALDNKNEPLERKIDQSISL